MTENEKRNKIVECAKSYYLVKQGSERHKNIIDRYNAHKPLPRGYKVSYTDYWCATFVSSIAIECGMSEIIPIECSCNRMIAIAKTMGIWNENDGYIPKMGDLIMYDWDDNGKGDCTGEVEHVGVVTYVASNSFVVFEGNKNKKVDSRVMAINGKYIRGFITPKYGDVCGELKCDIDKIAHECIQGKYGNGIERRQRLTQMGYNYAEVQKRINELLKK